MSEMALQDGSGRPRWYPWVLAGITLAAAALRIAWQGHPMRYDESFMFLLFVLPGGSSWLEYLAPNNHVLHTLLVRGSMETFGVAPWAIRLPALLAGVALVPTTAALARRLSGRVEAGVLAGLWAGASSILVEYSANARGYSLLCLCAEGLALCTWRIVSLPAGQRRWVTWIAWVAVAAAGLWTIPIMLYPIGLMALLLAAQTFISMPAGVARRRRLWHLAAALAATVALGVAGYAPVVQVSGLDAVLANRFVSPQPVGRVATALPGLLETTGRHWVRDAGWLGGLMILVGVAAATVWGLRLRRTLLWMPVVAAPLLIAAMFAQRVVPFPRVWLFCWPLAIATSAAGWAMAVGALRGTRRHYALAVVLSVGGAVAGWSAWRTMERPALISEDSQMLVEAETIALDLLTLNDGRTTVLSQHPSWPSLTYYLAYRGRTRFPWGNDPACRRAAIVVARGQTLETVLAAEENSVSRGRFGEPVLWKRYADATVYLAPAKQ